MHLKPFVKQFSWMNLDENVFFAAPNHEMQAETMANETRKAFFGSQMFRNTGFEAFLNPPVEG